MYLGMGVDECMRVLSLLMKCCVPVVIRLMCGCIVKRVSSVVPRIVTCVDLEMVCSCICMLGYACIGMFLRRVKKVAVVFCG